MSANRWSTCPQCAKSRTGKADALRKQASDGYGVISQREYLGFIREAEKADKETLPNAMREDWEIGLGADLEVFVDYRAYCETCGFKREFRRPERRPG